MHYSKCCDCNQSPWEKQWRCFLNSQQRKWNVRWIINLVYFSMHLKWCFHVWLRSNVWMEEFEWRCNRAPSIKWEKSLIAVTTKHHFIATFSLFFFMEMDRYCDLCTLRFIVEWSKVFKFALIIRTLQDYWHIFTSDKLPIFQKRFV